MGSKNEAFGTPHLGPKILISQKENSFFINLALAKEREARDMRPTRVHIRTGLVRCSLRLRVGLFSCLGWLRLVARAFVGHLPRVLVHAGALVYAGALVCAGALVYAGALVCAGALMCGGVRWCADGRCCAAVRWCTLARWCAYVR